MKLTLKQKRDIVRDFLRLHSVQDIALRLMEKHPKMGVHGFYFVERALRDYMTGKFQLKAKGK